MDTQVLNVRVMKESLILIGIGLLDLIVTIALINAHGAREGNPLMAYYLQFGYGVFVSVKLSLLFLPVFVAEWSKLYNPKFTRWMMRGAIAAYVGSYMLLFLTVNIAPRLTQGLRTKSHRRQKRGSRCPSNTG